MASPLKLRSGIRPSMIPAPNPHMECLRSVVRTTGREPGVYRWLNTSGEILYVGKAKDLRQRLRSYVAPTPRVEHFRKRALLENMAELKVTYTSSEVEALILEMHLIRSLKPRYNIALTREKHYVFVRISVQDDFPSVSLVNRRLHDGARYLGPYTNAWMQDRILSLLRELYGFRICSMGIGIKPASLFDPPSASAIPLELVLTRKDRRAPCLDYHIRRCTGPCTGEITSAEYMNRCITPVVDFYEGQTSAAVGQIMNRMKAATGDRKFEHAKEMSDLLSYLDGMHYQKKLFDPLAPKIDAIGFDETHSTAVVLQTRGGSLANEERIELPFDLPPRDVLSQIIPQIYEYEDDMPDTIAVPALPDDVSALSEWLRIKAGRSIVIRTPRKGDMLKLLRLAELNARRIGERSGRVSNAGVAV